VLTVDKLTYAGRRAALAEIMNSPRHRFLQADIADAHAMESAFRESRRRSLASSSNGSLLTIA
jgi:dTDP-glucose 4,6-dehydratase